MWSRRLLGVVNCLLKEKLYLLFSGWQGLSIHMQSAVTIDTTSIFWFTLATRVKGTSIVEHSVSLFGMMDKDPGTFIFRLTFSDALS